MESGPSFGHEDDTQTHDRQVVAAILIGFDPMTELSNNPQTLPRDILNNLCINTASPLLNQSTASVTQMLTTPSLHGQFVHSPPGQSQELLLDTYEDDSGVTIDDESLDQMVKNLQKHQRQQVQQNKKIKFLRSGINRLEDSQDNDKGAQLEDLLRELHKI